MCWAEEEYEVARWNVTCVSRCGWQGGMRETSLKVPVALRPYVPGWPLPLWILKAPCPECGGVVVPLRYFKKRKRALSPQQEDEVVSLYQSGWTVKEIAERFYVSLATISHTLTRREIKRRSKKRPISKSSPRAQKYNAQTEEMVDLYIGYGWTSAELAERYQIHPTNVVSRLNRAGVRMRTPGEVNTLLAKRRAKQRALKEQVAA